MVSLLGAPVPVTVLTGPHLPKQYLKQKYLMAYSGHGWPAVFVNKVLLESGLRLAGESYNRIVGAQILSLHKIVIFFFLSIHIDF